MPEKKNDLQRKTLYKKFWDILEGNTEWGKASEAEVSVIISRKFKLTKKDIRNALNELQEDRQLTTKKSHNGPTSIFLNRRGVAHSTKEVYPMDMKYQNAKSVKGQSLAGALIIFSIAVLIAFALLPAIQTAITCAALTGTNQTLAELVLLVFIVVIIFAGLRLAGLA